MARRRGNSTVDIDSALKTGLETSRDLKEEKRRKNPSKRLLGLAKSACQESPFERDNALTQMAYGMRMTSTPPS